MSDTLYADMLPYWQTSTTSPDIWLDKAKQEIVKAGGKATKQAYIEDGGIAQYMLGFSVSENSYIITWPVMRPRKPADMRAAKIQAATMLYHDVKSRCISARVLGFAPTFMQYLIVDGQPMARKYLPWDETT